MEYIATRYNTQGIHVCTMIAPWCGTPCPLSVRTLCFEPPPSPPRRTYRSSPWCSYFVTQTHTRRHARTQARMRKIICIKAPILPLPRFVVTGGTISNSVGRGPFHPTLEREFLFTRPGGWLGSDGTAYSNTLYFELVLGNFEVL